MRAAWRVCPAEVVMDLATDMFLVIVRGEGAGGEAVA